MENGQFHKFIIITMMLPFAHDPAIGWEEVLGVLQEALWIADQTPRNGSHAPLHLIYCKDARK